MSKEYEDLLKTMSVFLEEEKYEDALTQVNKAISLNSTDIYAWMNKADILGKTGHHTTEPEFKSVIKRKREIFGLETGRKKTETEDLRILMSDLDTNGAYVDLKEAKLKLRDNKIAYAKYTVLQEEIQSDGVIGSLNIPDDIGGLIGTFMFTLDVRLKTYQEELTDTEIIEHFKDRGEHKDLIDGVEQLKNRCDELKNTEEHEEIQTLYENLIDHLRDYTTGHIQFELLCVNVIEAINQSEENSIYLFSKTKKILDSIKSSCNIFYHCVYLFITLPVRRFSDSYRSRSARSVRVQFATTQSYINALLQSISRYNHRAHVTNTDNPQKTTKQSLSTNAMSIFKSENAAIITPIDQQQTTVKSLSASFMSFFEFNDIEQNQIFFIDSYHSMKLL